MEITGKCFCGEVHYRAVIDEHRVVLCHCTDCQTFGGSAFRMLGIANENDFAFTRGEPRTFIKTTERGPKRNMVFCPNCGTHLCAQPHPESDNRFVAVRLGTSDNFAELQPGAEVWCKSRVPWLEPFDGLVQFEKQPVA